MADYRIFEVDGMGQTYGPADIAQFESDADALARAIAKRRANVSEAWCGARLARRVERSQCGQIVPKPQER